MGNAHSNNRNQQTTQPHRNLAHLLHAHTPVANHRNQPTTPRNHGILGIQSPLSTTHNQPSTPSNHDHRIPFHLETNETFHARPLFPGYSPPSSTSNLRTRDPNQDVRIPFEQPTTPLPGCTMKDYGDACTKNLNSGIVQGMSFGAVYGSLTPTAGMGVLGGAAVGGTAGAVAGCLTGVYEKFGECSKPPGQ